MGACVFSAIGTGKTAREAFRQAVEHAQWEDGHGGYTGTIAEKSEFVMIACPEDITPDDYANLLVEKCDPRIDDKWGPAGCIDLKDGRFLFFGWASS